MMTLKQETKAVHEENKSLIMALQLLNSEIEKKSKHATRETNLHTNKPSWETA